MSGTNGKTTTTHLLTAAVRASVANPDEVVTNADGANLHHGIASALSNHPEAGIVGVGRIVDKPWAVDGQLALRKVTQLVLAFDHRVCDGGVAGGFLRFVADCVEHPMRLLAEG